MIRMPVDGVSKRGAAQAALRRPAAGVLARTAGNAMLVGAVLASAGCYSYTVIEPSQASPGLEVRARVTTAESARLEDLVGLRSRVISGEIVGVEPSALVLSIPNLAPEPGMNGMRLHQHVPLTASEIVELEQRQLSRWRTYSLVGAAAVVVGYVVAATFMNEDGEGGIDKPNPNNIVLPIRFRFP